MTKDLLLQGGAASLGDSAEHERVLTMRRAIGLFLSAAMLGGGLYLIYLELFEARVVSRKMMVVGVFLALLGGAWLWADCIAPQFGKKVDF